MVELRTGEIQQRGDVFLGGKFQVVPWSQDFYRVISTIMDRIEALKFVFMSLELDDDYRQEMGRHLDDIALAFSPASFNNEWRGYGLARLGLENVQPVKVLSGLVRQKISSRKLSQDDLAQIVSEVIDLIGWLEDHQLSEQEFIRQALIDGLKHLLFRLERFRWLGWGYTLESLREVIGAYLLLERQGINTNVNPDSAAVLFKVGGVIKSIYEKLEKVKSLTENVDFVLKAYGAVSLIQAGASTVTGLLSSQ